MRVKFLSIFLILVSTATLSAENLRIAMLGDSLTQGYGLVASDGLTAQLQVWLDQNMPQNEASNGSGVTIINAGVSGDTTSGGLSRAAWTLTPDVNALIVALGGNDVLRGTAPQLAKENLSGILEIAAERDLPVLLVGMSVPTNFGEAYKRDFEAIYPTLSEQFGTLYYDNLLRPLFAKAPMSELLTTHFQPDGLHPNAAGVKIVVEGLGPAVLALVDAAKD